MNFINGINDFPFLFFHEAIHFLIAIFISSLFYWKFRTKKIILIIFIATFLIDLDHLFDYFYFAGDLKFWIYFSKIDFFNATQKVFVPLHSWELVFFLGLYGRLRNNSLLLGASAAIAGHLFIDQFSYTPNPLAYFLLLRIANNFDISWYNGV